MRAVLNGNKEIAELIVNTASEKLNPDEFKIFLTKTNKNDDNILTHSAVNRNKEAVELIVNIVREKLSPDEFKTFLTQTNEDGNNALTLTLVNLNKKTIELIVNTASEKLSPDEFKTFLTQADRFSDNALMRAVLNGNKEIAELIVNTASEKLSPDELKTFLNKRMPENIALEWTKEILVGSVKGTLVSCLYIVGVVVALNSISENPVKGVPDLLPNYPEQVNNKKNLRVPEPPKMPTAY